MKSSFVFTHSMTQWEMMRQEPELKREFDSYMSVRRNGLRVPWHEMNPASTELDVKGYSEPHEPPLLIDIGGNTGYYYELLVLLIWMKYNYYHY